MTLEALYCMYETLWTTDDGLIALDFREQNTSGSIDSKMNPPREEPVDVMLGSIFDLPKKAMWQITIIEESLTTRMCHKPSKRSG
jgi:hypothetical protein